MLTLYDYLPSQNGWKVRQLLQHLDFPYQTEIVSIFEGQGQRPQYLEVNPWGAVPAIRFDDGRVLSESNAILWYLSSGSAYRPTDEFDAAKVLQWLSFETDYVQPSIGSLRYWTLTGKLARRTESIVIAKRLTGERALKALNRHLERNSFLVGQRYSIADIAIFAYAHLACDAGFSTESIPAFAAWTERVRTQQGFLAKVFPYLIDPHSTAELP